MSYSLITYALYPTWLLGPWGFSRQEYWSGLLFPSSADLSDPEMEQEPLMSPALASGFLTTSATWEALLLIQFSSVAQSCPTLCDPMDCSTLGCPSPTPRACSNSCPLGQWCHPTISFSVVPFSSCLQSFPASGCFLVSQFFTSGG